MFGQTNRLKKSKSKHSDGSGGSASKAVTVNLMSNEEHPGADTLSSTNRKSGSGTAAKSDHGDKKYGFFENFRRKVASFGRKDAQSQGVIDHMDPVDLLDLAADLGCISAEEQSFTFKPESNDKADKSKQDGSTKQFAKSNGITFSD